MFDERKHPRDTDGKFTDGNGGNDRADKLATAVKKYSDTPEKDLKDIPSPRGKNKSESDFFGEEFKGVKGAAAIEKLLQEKRGHVKNAFERPEVGGIDLVWGDKHGGLLHTIQKRDRLYESGKGTIRGLDMVKKIPEIIENGEFVQDDDGRINIDHDGYRVGIVPKYFDKKINWIVTAMERWK